MLPTLRLVSLALALGTSQPPAPAAACPSLGALKPPAVPAALQPPPDATLMTRYRAQGAQIYTCKATAGASPAYAWSLKAPDATLLDEACKPVGTHFAGPTWKATADASAVVGMKLAEAPAPVAGAVPWLLLKVTSTSGQGLMSGVVAVQRVDTTGGVPPAGPCSAAAVGSELRVPYTATYYFYKN
jgi:hypothetical protein